MPAFVSRLGRLKCQPRDRRPWRTLTGMERSAHETVDQPNSQNERMTQHRPAGDDRAWKRGDVARSTNRDMHSSDANAGGVAAPRAVARVRP